MSDVPATSKDAYRKLIEAGDDVMLRRKVAAALAEEPRTTHELVNAVPDHTGQAIRPRVTELVRMGCVERDGKKLNPSGHEAYVHRLTELGEKYVNGEANPEPDPTLAEHKTKVVDVAREFLRGNTDEDVLQLAVEKHDRMKRRMDPEWEP